MIPLKAGLENQQLEAETLSIPGCGDVNYTVSVRSTLR